MYLPEDASRAMQYRKCPIHKYFSHRYFSVLMYSLQMDSTVCAFLFHSRVCGPHVNFRGVDRKALTRTAASPYIDASGWFASLSWSCSSSLVVGHRWLVGWSCHSVDEKVNEKWENGRYSVSINQEGWSCHSVACQVCDWPRPILCWWEVIICHSVASRSMT